MRQTTVRTGCRSMRIAVLAAWVMAAGLAVLPAAYAGQPRVKCTITGTSGDDTLHGTARSDTICGRGGNDVVYGARGGDAIDGGPGRDRLYGGRGDDFLFGGPGQDKLIGGAGQDRSTQGSIPNKIGDFGVDVQPTYIGIPDGTVVIWLDLTGNCSRQDAQTRYTLPAPANAEVPFVGLSGPTPFDHCAWERSNNWFRVLFQLPSGGERHTDVNVTQTNDVPSPSGGLHTFLVDCQSGDVRCKGSSDTAIQPKHVKPAVTFGPL